MASGSDIPGGAAPPPRPDRARREAEALRANLARRKAQTRARAESPPAPAGVPRCRNLDMLRATLDLDGRRVVDVGCGDGAALRQMDAAGAQVVGVECSPHQLERARAEGAGGRGLIVAGVGEALPLPAAWADVVVFFNSLHHIPVAAQGRAMAEAARVLRPGGVVYVAEPEPDGAFFEAVRPIDDETWVRGAAWATVRGAWALGLEHRREIRYLHPLVLRDYETFRERIISANAGREARFAALDAEMRDRFARLATPSADGGFAFEQPMRVDLLERR